MKNKEKLNVDFADSYNYLYSRRDRVCVLQGMQGKIRKYYQNYYRIKLANQYGEEV
jgi:hypothetical protein